jgi:hypothetical protein
MASKVLIERIHHDPWNRHCPSARTGLGRPVVQVSFDVDERLSDLDPTAQEVDTLGTQPHELACPEASIGAEKHETPVALVHRGGDFRDLNWLEEPHHPMLVAGQLDPVAR